MTLIAHFRRVCLPLFLLLAMLSACPAFAVTMDVSAGFDGVARSNAWTPIAVKLVNNSSEDVQGTIVITQPRATGSMPVCTSVVSLPANSQKLYHSYVRIVGYNGEFDVSLMDHGNSLVTTRININAAPVEDRLIVSVGQRSARLAFLQGETMPAVVKGGSPAPYSGAPAPTATVHAGFMPPSLLPDRPAAYEGVDVLVISDMDPSAVSPQALKALSMWVASGGTMVISSGADYQRYTNDFYSELLPVAIEGATNIAGASTMSALGKAQFPAGPVAVTRTRVKPGVGRVMVAEGGVPLVVERSYGVGKVIFVAFDYKASPFRDWNGQPEFWKGLIQAPVKSPMVPSITVSPEEYRSYSRGYYGYTQMQFGMMDLVAQNPQVKMPSFVTIALFLGTYLVVLVPVNYVALRRRRRLELAWVTTPIIVLVFTLGAYAIGYTMKGSDLKVREAVLVEGSSGVRYARMVANASIFSPARRTYNVKISDPTVICQSLVLGEREAFPAAYMGGKETRMDLGMAMWSSKSLEAVGGVDLGGTLKSDLVAEGSHIKGTLTNGTKIAFKECRIVYSGGVANISDIAPGATVRVDCQCTGSLGSRHIPPQFVPGSGQPNSGDVRMKLDGYVFGRAFAASEPVLIAQASGDPAFDLSDSRPSVDSARFYAIHLDYNVGGTFNVPASAVPWQMTDAANVQQSGPPSSEPGANAAFYGTGKCSFLFTLPALPAGSRVSSLHLEATGALGGVEFSILDRSNGNWERIQLGSGKTISDPAKYIGQGNQVKIMVVSTKGDYHNVRVKLSAAGVGH